MIAKCTWTVHDQKYPIYVLQLLSPKFHSTSSRSWVTGHYETTAPNDTKITLKTKGSKVPHMHVFCPKGSRFWVTGHIEINALNGPKLTLNTKGQKFSIFMTTNSPTCNPFWSTASCFNVTILRKVTPKITLNIKRPKSKIPHICRISIPESQISVLLYD